MRIRRLLILALVVGAACFLFLARSKPYHDLTYEGHSIEYWFSQLPLTIVGTNSNGLANAYSLASISYGQTYGSVTGNSAYFEAFASFGTRAGPYLMAKLAGEDSRLELLTRKLLRHAGLKSIPFREASEERAQAVTGLDIMHELPPKTLIELTNLTTNADPYIAAAAHHVLLHDAEAQRMVLQRLENRRSHRKP